MKRAYKRYLRTYAAATLLLGAPFLIALLFVARAGELTPVADVARIQQETDALYGTAFNDAVAAYKLALVREIRPKVVALGSSRVMQFRRQFFTGSFVNCGGVFPDIPTGARFLDALLATHKPEVIILGLDFWWFNPNREEPESTPPIVDHSSTVTLAKLTRPLLHVAEGKVTAGNFSRIILRGADAANPYARYPGFGLSALLHSSGFRRDGSYFYGGTILGGIAEDPEFKDTLGRIERRDRRFEEGAAPDPERLKALVEMVRTIRAKGVEVALFLPPLAPSIVMALDALGRDYAYIPMIAPRLGEMGLVAHDMLGVAGLGATDCEFVDGFHGGDVVYQRILLRLAQKEPWLAGWLDVPGMRKTVDAFAGNCLSVYRPDMYEADEIDFLRIGCEKER